MATSPLYMLLLPSIESSIRKLRLTVKAVKTPHNVQNKSAAALASMQESLLQNCGDAIRCVAVP